jgi:hypothetical protein
MDQIAMPSVHVRFDESRLAPLGRRFLNEATETLPENPSFSVESEDHTDPIRRGLGPLGRRNRHAKARRIPEPWGM